MGRSNEVPITVARPTASQMPPPPEWAQQYPGTEQVAVASSAPAAPASDPRNVAEARIENSVGPVDWFEVMRDLVAFDHGFDDALSRLPQDDRHAVVARWQ